MKKTYNNAEMMLDSELGKLKVLCNIQIETTPGRAWDFDDLPYEEVNYDFKSIKMFFFDEASGLEVIDFFKDPKNDAAMEQLMEQLERERINKELYV